MPTRYNPSVSRSLRITLGAIVLVLLVAGTAFATRSNPGDHHPFPAAASKEPKASADASESEGESLTDDHAAALVDLLDKAGISGVSADELKSLAAKYGVGGAVRLEAWAKASGKSVSELAAMFDGGTGWGAIAHQLNAANASLHLSPGIGWIMSGGHGHGAQNAAKPKDNGESESESEEPEASGSSD